MSEIRQVVGREVLDSRGYPTVEAEVSLESGARGRAIVPSGASTGRYEALELRDGDPDRFGGRGVRQAVGHVNGEIRETTVGVDAREQGTVDRHLIELDGSPDKGRLGANAILAVSMATARAAADDAGQPLYRYLGGDDAHVLPVPMLNVLNGGAHADNSVDIQEFMVVPAGLNGFSESLRAGAEIFHALRATLQEQGQTTAVGDEGGVAPDLPSNEAALELVTGAVGRAGYELAEEVLLALDCAATELLDADREGYVLEGEGVEATASELVELYGVWADRYPVTSVEDGLAEDDWDGWAELTRKLGDRLQLVGDDLFVTNVARIRRGVEEGVANAVLVKLNQIGTVSETLEAIAVARGAGYGVVISHRSGETEDTFIADLAVATRAGQIKTGSACRSERVAKYNRLLRIEEELGEAAVYPGREPYRQREEAARG